MNPDLFGDPCEYIQVFFEKHRENKQITRLRTKYEAVTGKFPGNVEQNSKLVQSIKEIIWKYECKQNKKRIENLENSQNNQKICAANHEKDKINRQNMQKFQFFQKKLKEKLFFEKNQAFQRSFASFKKTLVRLCREKNKEIKEKWDFTMDNINSKQKKKEENTAKTSISEFFDEKEDDKLNLKEIQEFICNNDIVSEENSGFSEELSQYFLNSFIKMTENSIKLIREITEDSNNSQNSQKNDEFSKIHEIKRKYLNEHIFIKKLYEEIKEMSGQKEILWKKLEENLKRKEPEIAEKLLKLIEKQTKDQLKSDYLASIKQRNKENQQKKLFHEVDKKIQRNFEETQVFSLEELVERNIESLKRIQKEKVQINDAIFEFISQFFKEISDQFLKFKCTNDTLSNLIANLSYEKIQDNSRLIPNTFIHKMDLLCNNDAPSEKFKGKAEKYQKNIKFFKESFRKIADVSGSLAYFNKITQYIDKNCEEFKENMKKLLTKFANFLQTNEKLQILIESFKVNKEGKKK